MKGSYSLGQIAGINIRIHWTFTLIIAWAVYMGWSRGGDPHAVFWTTTFVLTIFGCIVLHELGHSLTARRFGIKTRMITLLPIGGVATLERMPEEPKQELLVAMMGPVVNVVIAALLYFFVRSQLEIFQRPEEAVAFFQTVTAENFLVYLFITNIILVIFNAIPAFPMDGGRVLRALLSMKMDRVRATRVAAQLGQLIAFFFFFIGFVYNPMLIFIGLFVFFGASNEYLMIRQLSILKGHKVREAMMSDFTVLHPEDSLDKIGQSLLSGTERNFIVARDRNTVLGLLFQVDMIEAFQGHDRDLKVSDLMDSDFITMGPDNDLGEVYRKVQNSKQYFFPVIENGVLIGVIDMENINEFIMIQASLNY